MTDADPVAAALADMPLPDPPAEGDKRDRGSVLVVAGGGSVPGAPLLVGEAALRVGAGRLRLVATRLTLAALGAAAPQARILLASETPDLQIAPPHRRRLGGFVEDVDAAVVGPGMIGATHPREWALALLTAAPDLPIVVDAAALPAPDRSRRFAKLAHGRVVLTPHAGEMAALLGVTQSRVTADPLSAAREAATRLQAVVVMKGARTFVTTPSGLAWRHDGGVSGLATSGSGDVLAGVIGGLLARGAPPAGAAVWGVHLHAAAGARLASEIGPLGFLASDLPRALPSVLTPASGGT